VKPRLSRAGVIAPERTPFPSDQAAAELARAGLKQSSYMVSSPFARHRTINDKVKVGSRIFGLFVRLLPLALMSSSHVPSKSLKWHFLPSRTPGFQNVGLTCCVIITAVPLQLLLSFKCIPLRPEGGVAFWDALFAIHGRSTPTSCRRRSQKATPPSGLSSIYCTRFHSRRV